MTMADDDQEPRRRPPSERQRFIEAIEEGLADVEAGRVIDDSAFGQDPNAALDRLFGPLESEPHGA